ncbi:MAG: CAAX prenyl protease-related protein [Verrucomicrobiales bacterium]
MGFLTRKFEASPALVRVLPFVVFAGFTSLQGQFGPLSHFWAYVLKTILGGIVLALAWPWLKEARWKISWEAILVGVAVFALWVGLDPLYPKWGKAEIVWNPYNSFPEGSFLIPLLIIFRIVGSTLIVPPIEEAFYRSFVYRTIIAQDFDKVPLTRFHLPAFLVTSIIFGAVHREWLAGILCGLAYQWLVIRKGRLGEAMTAHAITNLLLGCWVWWKGAWNFW